MNKNLLESLDAALAKVESAIAVDERAARAYLAEAKSLVAELARSEELVVLVPPFQP
jgi:hypothetical protein